MTVRQYRELPAREDVIQELHWGQVVDLSLPKMKHAKLQSRLVRLLRPRAEHLGVVESEVGIRALAEYDLRCADVAFVSQNRWDATDDEDNLHGSPEMVIEVLSPSNTKLEMREKATLYLSSCTCKTGAGSGAPREEPCCCDFVPRLASAPFALSTGAQEFWVVDPKKRNVIVMHREAGTLVYEDGQHIAMSLFGGELSVAEIFA